MTVRRAMTCTHECPWTRKGTFSIPSVVPKPRIWNRGVTVISFEIRLDYPVPSAVRDVDVL